MTATQEYWLVITRNSVYSIRHALFDGWTVAADTDGTKLASTRSNMQVFESIEFIKHDDGHALYCTPRSGRRERDLRTSVVSAVLHVTDSTERFSTLRGFEGDANSNFVPVKDWDTLTWGKPEVETIEVVAVSHVEVEDRAAAVIADLGFDPRLGAVAVAVKPKGCTCCKVTTGDFCYDCELGEDN